MENEEKTPEETGLPSSGEKPGRKRYPTGLNKLQNLEDLRRFVANTLRNMRMKRMDPNLGRALFAGCSIMEKLMGKMDVDKRLDELEQRYVALQAETEKLRREKETA